MKCQTKIYLQGLLKTLNEVLR